MSENAKKKPVDSKMNKEISKYTCPECGIIVGVRRDASSCIMESCPFCKTELDTKGLQ